MLFLWVFKKYLFPFTKCRERKDLSLSAGVCPGVVDYRADQPPGSAFRNKPLTNTSIRQQMLL
jgi:hypothetical protein